MLDRAKCREIDAPLNSANSLNSIGTAGPHQGRRLRRRRRQRCQPHDLRPPKASSSSPSTPTSRRSATARRTQRPASAASSPAASARVAIWTRGRDAADESRTELGELMKDADMVFITAGMGGGTGTGSAPIVAELAKESGALTIGVVTRPFDFEGSVRNETAEDGIKTLEVRSTR